MSRIARTPHDGSATPQVEHNEIRPRVGDPVERLIPGDEVALDRVTLPCSHRVRVSSCMASRDASSVGQWPRREFDLEPTHARIDPERNRVKTYAMARDGDVIVVALSPTNDSTAVA